MQIHPSNFTLQPLPGSISKPQCFLAYLFLHFQLFRRFYENSRICLFSNTSIHLSHYLAGYLFYVGINLLQFNLLFRNEVQTGKRLEKNRFRKTFRFIEKFSYSQLFLPNISLMFVFPSSNNRLFFPFIIGHSGHSHCHAHI